MSDLCRLIWYALIGLFRPRTALQAEILVLRHQLNMLRRLPKEPEGAPSCAGLPYLGQTRGGHARLETSEPGRQVGAKTGASLKTNVLIVDS